MRILLTLLSTALLMGAAHAEAVTDLADGRVGRIEFLSPTPNGPSQLVQRSYGDARATIWGVLSLPITGAGRMPAVIIAHGSGGVSEGREGAWAAKLNKLGLASFVVDSFKPRGLTATATDQSKLSTLANVADALSALKLLATHPRIDAKRIVIMGFSRGGQVALYTALEPARRGVIDDELRFAAHIALYPSCNIPYRAETLGGAPMLMLLAALDDYTPAAACQDYARWFEAKGTAVTVKVYQGAYHDFDIAPAPRFYDNLQTAKNCNAEVQLESGVVRKLDTGEQLRGPAVGEYFRSCFGRGATYGGNAAALAQAERDIAEFLRQARIIP